MSNIQTLIDTIKEENFENREISLNIDAVNQNTQIGWLEMINQNLSELRAGFYQYMEDERDRFIEQQADLKAARRAEAERLKEAQAKGFAPTDTGGGQQTSPAAPSGDGGGSLFAGLGIAGLLTGIGAAISGYTVGLINNLIKIITLGKFDPKLLDNITKAVKAIPNAIRGFALGSIMQIQSFLNGLPKPSMPKGLTDAGKAITTFFKENKIGQVLAKIGNVLKTVGASIASVFDMRPILDAVKTLGGGQGGGILSKIGNFFGRLGKMFGTVFTVASKIAVPITAIIASVKAIFSSFGEFNDEMGFFEKYLIVVKNLAKELISGFITMPLELLKDFISWTAGKLGFEGVEKFLDSFDIDAKFREIFDGFIDAVGNMLTRISDFVYSSLRAIGIGDVDPEAEARIAQRKVDSAEESLAEADARVLEAQAAVDAAEEGSTEQARARGQLNRALAQRNARAEDFQEAQAGAQEAQVYTQTALDEDTQASSLQAAEDSGLYDPDGFGNSEVDKDVLAQTTDVNQLKAIINDQDISTEDKRLVLNRIQELESTTAPEQQTYTGMRAARRAAEEQGLSAYRIEPVTEDDGFGEQVETGQYRLIAQSPDDQVLKNRTPLRQQLQQALDSGTDFDDEQMLAIELGKMQGVDFPSEVENQYNKQLETVANENNQLTVANQTATGDQISTGANQTYMGLQAARDAAIEQELKAFRIEPVTEDDGFGEQVETGEYRVIPRETAAAVVEPRVEPLSDLTNVTSINQATTSMQAALSSIIPSEAGDLNLPGQDGIDGALSPASIMGAGLGAVVDGVKNLTSLPVGQASQEVAAAKDRPPVVAMGGSTTSIQNNVSSPNVHNYGSMSARSNDLSSQRLKDNMMA